MSMDDRGGRERKQSGVPGVLQRFKRERFERHFWTTADGDLLFLPNLELNVIPVYRTQEDRAYVIDDVGVIPKLEALFSFWYAIPRAFTLCLVAFFWLFLQISEALAQAGVGDTVILGEWGGYAVGAMIAAVLTIEVAARRTQRRLQSLLDTLKEAEVYPHDYDRLAGPLKLLGSLLVLMVAVGLMTAMLTLELSFSGRVWCGAASGVMLIVAGYLFKERQAKRRWLNERIGLSRIDTGMPAVENPDEDRRN